MKFFSSKYILSLCNKNILFKNSFRAPYSKLKVLTCQYCSYSFKISESLLNNSRVRSHLDKLISKDYSESMSKPNVAALINAIRSVKIDLHSLNEFDTG